MAYLKMRAIYLRNYFTRATSDDQNSFAEHYVVVGYV